MTEGVTRHLLERLKDCANGSSQFRNLGTIDCHFGIKSGSDIFAIKFESFTCVEVRLWEEDRLRELDFYFEMKQEEWQDWFCSLEDVKSVTDKVGLNEMDLKHPDGVLRCFDEVGRLKFFRYMNSLQEFFNCVGSSDFRED